MRNLTYAGLVLVTIICIGLVIAWLNHTLKKDALSKINRPKVIFGVIGIIVAWLAVTAALAQTGFLSVWHSIPPRVPLIPITALISVILLNRSTLFKKLIDATPRHWAVAMQSFRIGVELAFWGLFSSGGAPIQVTFEGRNFDVLVGLSAPFVALAMRKLNLRPQLVIAWNFLGLAILGNTIVTTLTSTPGPLFMNWPEPFTAFATWPFVWIPGLLAPLAILLHIVSIRQNLTALKSEGKKTV